MPRSGTLAGAPTRRSWLRRPWSDLFDRNRIVRFGLAGIASTITHATVYYGLLWGAECSAFYSYPCGFVASLLVSYYLNLRWTFAGSRSDWRTFCRFVLATLFGLGAGQASLWVFIKLAAVPPGVAFLLVVPVPPACNFLSSSLWVFRPADPSGSSPQS